MPDRAIVIVLLALALATVAGTTTGDWVGLALVAGLGVVTVLLLRRR